MKPPYTADASQVRDADGARVADCYRGPMVPTDDEAAPARRRAVRIAACLNACDGIEDPAATLAEVREVLRAINAWNEADHASNGDRPNYEALDHTIGRACRALSLLTPKATP